MNPSLMTYRCAGFCGHTYTPFFSSNAMPNPFWKHARQLQMMLFPSTVNPYHPLFL